MKYEGFTDGESTFDADNCGADRMAEAAEKAKSYMQYFSFSRDGLIQQLEYEVFTEEQSTYGASTVGY